jgi:phosphate/sulfate permease
MAGDRGKRGGGLNKSMVWRIVMAWLVTVPVTIAIAAGLFYDPLQVRTRLPAGGKRIRTIGPT